MHVDVRSERAALSKAISRLWNPLFLVDDLAVHLHVVQSFKVFIRTSTLASDGVNVVEQAVPPECKAEFSELLCVRPEAHLSDVLPLSVWNVLPGACRTKGPDRADGSLELHPDLPGVEDALARYQVLGACSAVQGGTAEPAGGADSSAETGVKWKSVERDCSALELMLPRVEAAVGQERPSKQLKSRLLEITNRLERMRTLLASDVR